jgi:predicted site-specific integrase-resolvase
MMNQDGYNATQVAEGLGVDLHIVTQWIGRGFLKAEKRGSNRVNDIWYLEDKAVKTFIINHIGIIDIRRVEKIWFVDVLIN